MQRFHFLPGDLINIDLNNNDRTGMGLLMSRDSSLGEDNAFWFVFHPQSNKIFKVFEQYLRHVETEVGE
jgi:hypothetical protein